MFLVILNTMFGAVILPMVYHQLSRFSSISTAPPSLPVLKFIILLLLLFIEWAFLIYNTSRIVDTYLETGVHLVEAEDQDKIARSRIQICLLIALGITFVSVAVAILP